MIFIQRLFSTILLSFILLTVLSGALSAQVDNRIPFKHRVGQPPPEENLFHIRGDFTIIGNTNLTLKHYSDTSLNSLNEIVFVDIDKDQLTFNSSSATLQFSQENDSDPACTEILYAGLYWSGRTEFGKGMTFELTKGTIKEEPQKVEASTKLLSDGDHVSNSSYTLYIHHQFDELAMLSPLYFLVSEFGHEEVEFQFTNGGRVEYRIGEREWTAVQNLQVKTGAGVSIATFDPITFSEGPLSITIDQLSRSTETDYQNIVARDNRMQVTTSGMSVSEFLNTQHFDKRKVKLKGPGATDYTEVRASGNSILFPQEELDGMFVGYADVTDYVKSHGAGEYTVANIALTEGWGDATGLFGHWGLVVVYQNPKMDARDVTIFDGYSYVRSSNLEEQIGEIEISGFGAVKQGSVNLKLGLMAGEGDRSITGDFLKIINQKGEWVSLQHTMNEPENFFNSSIYTPVRNKSNKLIEPARNPRLLNNTGIDIVMWDIPNPNNSIIANEQTSTRFRFGTKQDVYAIYAFAFSVRSYSPDVVVTNRIESIHHEAPGEYPVIKPGQEITFTLEIKNKGKEATEQTQLVIPLPYTAEFVSAETLPEGYGTVKFDPSSGQTGAIIWDIGDIPLPEDPDEIIAALQYTLKVTEDCFILANDNCEAIVSINGFISGVGSNSGNVFKNLSFPQSNMDGDCAEEDAGGVWNIPITGRAEFARARCAGYDLFSGLGDISIPEFCQNDVPVDLLELISPSQDNFNVYFFTAETGGSPLYSYYVNTSVAGTEQVWVSEGPAGSCTGFRIPVTLTVTPTAPVPHIIDKTTCANAGLHCEVTPIGDYQLLYYMDDDPQSSPLDTVPMAGSDAGEYVVWVSQYKKGECESRRKKVIVTVEDCPAIRVSITPDVPYFYKEGEKISYELVVENVGKTVLKNVRIQESLTNTSWGVSILQPAQRKVFSTTYVTNEMDLIYKIVSNSLYAESTSPEGYYVSDYQYADVLGLSPSFLDFAVTTVDVFCSEGENAFGYINIEFKEVQTGNYQLTNLTTGISVADSFYQQQAISVEVPAGDYTLSIFENPAYVHHAPEVYTVKESYVDFIVPEEIIGCIAYNFLPIAHMSLSFQLIGPDGRFVPSEMDGSYQLRQTGTYQLIGRDPEGLRCPLQKAFDAIISRPLEMMLELLPFCAEDAFTSIQVNEPVGDNLLKWFKVEVDEEVYLSQFDNQNTISVAEEGLYKAVLSDQKGCVVGMGSSQVLRLLSSPPLLNPVYTICPTSKTTTSLHAGDDFVSAKWMLDGLEVSNTIHFTPRQAGTYSLIATDQNGCDFFVDFEVEEKCFPTIRYPNAIRLGTVDKGFVAYPDNLIADLEIVIHNRWGEIIFHCADNKLEYGKPSTCIWDGTYQGKKIPNGNYSLTLRYKIKDSSEVVTERASIHVLE